MTAYTEYQHTANNTLNTKELLTKVIDESDEDRSVSVTPILINATPSLEVLDTIIADLIDAGGNPTPLFTACLEAIKTSVTQGVVDIHLVLIGVTGFGNLVILEDVNMFKRLGSVVGNSSTFISMTGLARSNTSERLKEAIAVLTAEVNWKQKPKPVTIEGVIADLKQRVAGAEVANKEAEKLYSEFRNTVNLSRKTLHALTDKLQKATNLLEERDRIISHLNSLMEDV